MRAKIAKIYDENLNNCKNIITPKKTKNGFHVYHQYTILSKNRDIIKTELEKNNIGSAIYYPISLEKQNVYKNSFNDETELYETQIIYQIHAFHCQCIHTFLKKM
jgi:dTDP-4-amino-4,6-dideoxygalactose transaminase